MRTGESQNQGFITHDVIIPIVVRVCKCQMQGFITHDVIIPTIVPVIVPV